MTLLTFNTKEHKLTFVNDFYQLHTVYENVKTIKDNTNYYEVFQARDEDGKGVPILRVPILDTIIIYEQ